MNITIFLLYSLLAASVDCNVSKCHSGKSYGCPLFHVLLTCISLEETFEENIFCGIGNRSCSNIREVPPTVFIFLEDDHYENGNEVAIEDR